MKLIQERLNEFKNVNLYFISKEPSFMIKQFSNGKYPELFYQDIDNQLINELHIKKYPTILLFNNKNILLKEFNGAVPLNELLKHILK